MKNLSLHLALALLLVGCKNSPEDWGRTYEDGLAAYEADYKSVALEIWKPLANQGDNRAQYEIGKYYFHKAVNYDKRWNQGDNYCEAGTNYAIAIDWLYRAAVQGNVDAQYELGSVYLQCSGLAYNDVKKSKYYPEATKWLYMAAEAGNVEAINKSCRINEIGTKNYSYESDVGKLEALLKISMMAAKNTGGTSKDCANQVASFENRIKSLNDRALAKSKSEAERNKYETSPEGIQHNKKIKEQCDFFLRDLESKTNFKATNTLRTIQSYGSTVLCVYMGYVRGVRGDIATPVTITGNTVNGQYEYE